MSQFDYTVGNYYTMIPREIRKDARDNDYLVIIDQFGDREYRAYPQLVKFSENNLPLEVKVKLISKDIYGRPQFILNEGELIREHYEQGKPYIFTIIDSRDDPKSNAHYYMVEDDFSRHRFYINENEKYHKGEDYVLIVKDFNNKGFLIFDEPQDNTTLPAAPIQQTSEDSQSNYSQNGPVLNIGDEGTTLEFKTSIAFLPDGSGADIDNQLDTIVKELCSFMNTEGGELYIGVHDKTKRVVGFVKDYKYLNEGSDIFNGSYGKNHDGYELKIRNAVDYKCNSVANSLIEFNFEKEQNAEYCKISVRKSQRPIWFNKTQLWIRQGNRLKRLTGDDVTFFIASLMEITIKSRLEIEGTDAPASLLTKEDIEAILHKIIDERRQVDLPIPQAPQLDEVDYWLNWLDDGSWKRTKDKADDKQYLIQVPVPKNITNPKILFCYRTGFVNCMALDKFRKKSKRSGQLVVNSPWNTEGEPPINILIASPSDLLVGYSIDYNGNQYVKIHEVLDYKENASSYSKGGQFIPTQGYVMISFHTIDSSYKLKLKPLQRTKKDRSKDPGEPMNSSTYSQAIQALKEIIEK